MKWLELRKTQEMSINLKLYRGYANDEELIVFGHVFNYRTSKEIAWNLKGYHHAYNMVNLFRLKPIANIEVVLLFKNIEVSTKTMDDGYFRFTIPFTASLKSGWHEYKVTCAAYGKRVTQTSELLKPYKSKFTIISDIDDTFLISHSANIFKKLYVMLTKNIDKRKTFEDVVDHYQQLSLSGQDSDQASNSFFYVSSSEYNLYDFINQFIQLQGLPKGVIKLKKLKTKLIDFLKSGRGDHDHKFVKIKDIISFYPHLQYVLLGDDSQQDAYIYERICKTFPQNVKAVYIRQTAKKEKEKIQTVLTNLNDMGTYTCYFRDSHKAIAHSKEIGII